MDKIAQAQLVFGIANPKESRNPESGNLITLNLDGLMCLFYIQRFALDTTGIVTATDQHTLSPTDNLIQLRLIHLLSAVARQQQAHGRATTFDYRIGRKRG